MHGKENPLMDRKVVGVVLWVMDAMVAMVTSPTHLLDVVWCGAVVIVIVVHGIHVTQLHSQLPL